MAINFVNGHRNAGNEYQQGDIPIPRAPELENPTENGAVHSPSNPLVCITGSRFAGM